MEVNVLNIKGEDTGRKVTLDEQIFGIEPNDHVIYLDVKRYLAHQRQGTHKTKGRGEVAYSTRKLFRQKGTGGARRGSIKSPILRGGGTIFGPQPRTYEQKVNKKVKRLARRSALSYKAKANAILILEDFQFEQPKTKDFVALIKALKLNNSKALFLFDQVQDNVLLSARNLQSVSLQPVTSVNTYALLNAKYVVMTESALPKLVETLTEKAEK